VHVHVAHPVEPGPWEALERRLPSGATASKGGEAPPETAVLVDGRPSAETLDRLALRALIVPFAGLPAATRALLLDRPALAAYTLHHNAAATAEMAVALLLSVAREVPVLDAAMRRGEWSDRGEGRGMQLEGRRAVVLGYGEVGRRVARALVGLGMRVSAVRHTVRQAFDGDVALYSVHGLGQLWPIAEAIVVACPLTPETTGLIGAEVFDRLPPGAVMVNVARGPIVNEAALHAALDSGRLGGAGLDVWWNYPKGESGPTGEHDFTGFKNVVMTPHVGGTVSDTEERRMTELAACLRTLADDKEPPHRLDAARGY
jgi:phosphoglycerate dehydrogenase-like enzyme